MVQLTPKDFAAHRLIRQGDIIRLSIDNMAIMHTVSVVVNRPPMPMTELRRLEQCLRRTGYTFKCTTCRAP